MSTITNNPVVSLAGVSKTYRAGDVEVPAVKGVTFDIPRQRFSVIVGPSGSGKKTLLNLIGCIDKLTAVLRKNSIRAKVARRSADRLFVGAGNPKC